MVSEFPCHIKGKELYRHAMLPSPSFVHVLSIECKNTTTSAEVVFLFLDKEVLKEQHIRVGF